MSEETKPDAHQPPQIEPNLSSTSGVSSDDTTKITNEERNEHNKQFQAFLRASMSNDDSSNVTPKATKKERSSVDDDDDSFNNDIYEYETEREEGDKGGQPKVETTSPEKLKKTVGILRVPRYIRKSLAGSQQTSAVDKTSTPPPANKRLSKPPVHNLRNSQQRTSIVQGFRRGSQEEKVIGLKNMAMRESAAHRRTALMSDKSENRSRAGSRHSMESKQHSILPTPTCSIEEMEDEARRRAITNPLQLLWLGNVAAFKVLVIYLVTLETLVALGLTVGLTLYWYYTYPNETTNWFGGGMDFIVLAFAVTTPIANAIGMAFTRRERALLNIGDFRSFCYHLYMAHALWDWDDAKGGRAGANVDWVEHCDAVLAQLIGIGDELARFLSLPNPSRSRHRMTHSGRKEAARTMEVAYHLLESMSTQRCTRLILYSERLKKIGLPSGEISRIRQYERFISVQIEQLRQIKLYRTPQALRSFARIFTVVLAPLYAPAYAQVAKDLHSLGMGIAFGCITVLALTALFESLQVLEDPFTAYLALDGIDVREEFEVLHYAQLISVRRMCFPDAPEYPLGRRAALMSTPLDKDKYHLIGQPPIQSHHARGASKVPSLVNLKLDEADSIDQDTFVDEAEQDHADFELGTVIFHEDYDSDVRETAFAAPEPPPLDPSRFHVRNISALSLSERLSRRVLNARKNQEKDAKPNGPASH